VLVLLAVLFAGTSTDATPVNPVGFHNKANSPISTLYIEVNNANFINAGCYNVQSTGQPLFDIAIIFAANINFDTNQRKAVLYFNPNVATVLEGVNTYVRPLQAKGIKVLLSILGNHQGAGICNFENVAAARDFAIQLSAAVQLYGLDGIDFDDEYAGYGNNGLPQPNANSFLWLIRELRTLIPDKIISFYYYGPAASRLQSGDLYAGDFLDYSWNAMYGTYSVPNVPRMDNSKKGPAAVWVGRSGSGASMAERTVSDGYGVYLFYDLPNSDSNSYLSPISTGLYRSGSTLVGNCLRSWPPAGTLAEKGPRENMRKNVTTA